MSVADPAARAQFAIDDAVEADHAAVVARIASFPGAELQTGDGAQELLTGLSSGFFNNTILVRWAAEDSARLNAIVERARARGAPWRFYLTAATTPPTLGAALVAVGLVPGLPGRSMLLDDPRGAHAHAIDGLTIEPVTDAAGLERWIGVRIENNDWGVDAADAWRQAQTHLGVSPDVPMRSWTGLLDGEAVASVMVHLGDVRPDGPRDAGIYHVETVPRARRRGIASALTAHAIEAAVELGATRIVLSATRAAESAYARLGFRTGGSFTYWFDPELGA